MANPTFDRGMHQVIPAVMTCIGWKDEVPKPPSDRVFVAHRLKSTKRYGHLAVQIVRDDDQANRNSNDTVIPDYETSDTILQALTLCWSQNGGQNMGLPWSSLDFVFRSDGKVAMDFHGENAAREGEEGEETSFVQTVHDARENLFEELFCETFPKFIIKLKHLFGVWGMGGLVNFKITNPKIGGNYHVHSSFGLSNPDMPAFMVAKALQSDNPDATKSLLSYKEQRPLPRVGMAGYGYELFIVTEKQEDWCKFLMQWAVDKEIQTDVNFLARVEVGGGLTVENVPIGPTQMGNILIAPAQDPWPESGMLPNGKVRFFIMTVITAEEMKFAMENDRTALLQRLKEQKIGQVSDLDRLASS